MALNNNQKQMIADMLMRTESKADIKLNSEKILGNAYGDKATVKAFKELALMRIKRFN